MLRRVELSSTLHDTFIIFTSVIPAAIGVVYYVVVDPPGVKVNTEVVSISLATTKVSETDMVPNVEKLYVLFAKTLPLITTEKLKSEGVPVLRVIALNVKV